MKSKNSMAIRIGMAVVGLVVSMAVAATGGGPSCCAQTLPGQCGPNTQGIATDCKPACPTGFACASSTGCIGTSPWALASCVKVTPVGPPPGNP